MKTVTVLLYEGVDEMDFCGPLEVLASCRKVVDGKRTNKPAFHVETVAARVGSIRCAHGVQVLPDKSVMQALESDIVLVPGGPGARKDSAISPLLLEYLAKSTATAELVASVCTGAFIVAKAGLADGRRLATHHAATEELARQYPKVQVVPGQRVVTDGSSLISSAGVSAGIDLALALVERFEGREAARLTARRMEWPGSK